MSDELNMDEIKKSMEALRDVVSKGHSSKGTNTTDVPAMAGQGGATQVFHTPANSDPGSWAGSKGTDVPADGATDSVSDNGTDYDGRKVMKSIMTKIEKGLPLTKFEQMVLKGSMAEKLDMDKAFPPKKEDAKDDDSDKDDKKNPFAKAKDEDDDMDKSITNNPKLAPGFEVSDFLRDLAVSVQKSINSLDKSLRSHIDSRLAAETHKTLEISKSIAKAVGSIGDASMYTATTVAEMANGPARGPKAVTSISKSGPGPESTQTLTKAQMGNLLFEAVQKGLAVPQDVLKFDATGQVSPELLKRIGH